MSLNNSQKIESDQVLPHLIGSREGRIEMLGNTEVADAIKSFGPTSPKADFVVPPSEDTILEIPLSEYQRVMSDLALTYNQIAETVRLSGIMTARDLARLRDNNLRAFKAETTPTGQFLVLNAHIRKLQALVRDRLIKKTPKAERAAAVLNDSDDSLLNEITPTNDRERRAMTLLRALKLHPAEAICATKAKDVLEGAEGIKLDLTVVRRAMKWLAIKYPSLMVYEKFGKEYRIRTNFALNASRQGV